MAVNRRVRFDHFTDLPLGGIWGSDEWPDYVLVHHEGALDDVRYVPRRTCRVVRLGKPSQTGVPSERHCSECGGGLTRFGGYCPHCGARVVEED